MSLLLNPTVTELITGTFQHDARLVSLLSQTCKTYQAAFPTTYEMHELADWLIWQEQLGDSAIETAEGKRIFPNGKAKISPRARNGRAWLIEAQSGRQTKPLSHIGLIRLGKCSAKLTILGEAQWTMHKNSFYGVQDLRTFKQCLLYHANLCHDMLETLPYLPPTVLHRHRDSVPWTFARAFHVWRSTGKRKRGRDRDCVVELAHRVLFLAL